MKSTAGQEILPLMIEILKKQGICCILLDFHAEATAEKVALGYFLDGQVSAVIGTHTHVQTADERILPKGTAYITDAGMTGAQNSVIGMNIETAIKRFVNQMPEYYLIASPVDLACCAVYIQIDTNSGFALKIERLQLKI